MGESLHWEMGSIAVPVVLLRKYGEIGLQAQELLVLLQLQCLQEKEGKLLPSAEDVSFYAGLPLEQVRSILKKLLRNGFVQRERQPRGECYTFRPLWRKLVGKMEETVACTWTASSTLLHRIEEGFGRALSPLELETVGRWMEEGHSEALVVAALREAIFCDVFSIRYIDRILYIWKQQKIATPEEAASFAERYRRRRVPSAGSDSLPISAPGLRESPACNWLQSSVDTGKG